MYRLRRLCTSQQLVTYYEMVNITFIGNIEGAVKSIFVSCNR